MTILAAVGLPIVLLLWIVAVVVMAKCHVTKER
jgi:hypothetical protein